jgi:hypothetical protein
VAGSDGVKPADGDDYTYDLRTYPERTEARLEDYQRRIAVLEANVRHLEYLVHRLVNHAKQAAEDGHAHSKCIQHGVSS